MSNHQKSILICFAVLLLLLGGCKKDSYTCGFSYYYVPGRATFTGFTANELKVIIVNQYKANNNFDSLIHSDTLDGSSGLVKGDTIYYKINEGFFEVRVGVDFKVWLPIVGKEYQITEVRSFENEYSWTQEKPCARGASQTRFRPLAFKINGQDYPSDGYNSWHFFLGK